MNQMTDTPLAVSKQRITIKPDPRELRGLYDALKAMDKAANDSLKDEVTAISKWTQQGIVYASYSAPMPKQAAIVAGSIRANRDRIPYLTIGGTKGKAKNGTSSGVLLFGSEFGASPTSKAGAFPNGGRRFPYRSAKQGKGSAGYWIFPALKAMQPEITDRWKAAVDRVLNHWEDGPGGGLNG